jgi:hypothetical protein
MFLNKRTLIVLILIGGIGIGAAALSHPSNEFRNLKVLPKNVSSKELSRIMVDDFTDGLGVSCSFCHKEDKDSHKLDYASDENPEKQIARQMMRMAVRINRHYFKTGHAAIGDSTLIVTCYTCHKGTPRPSAQ